ncbi:hypothetical protein SO802_008200 [Lithocarpus litseifolius]|uniref:RNase H type-1 domain-containing protein n=1 Tax=Lithocarpus litseifolius TaxID=425828 RepID=A0AAW2DAN1_9ROSI
MRTLRGDVPQLSTYHYYTAAAATNLPPLPSRLKLAINLATCVAVNRGFENVVVKSDAKVCIEALKAPTDAMPWRISTITADTLSWASRGQQFVFRWSPRESNKAAHVLASWCLGKNLSGCFGQEFKLLAIKFGSFLVISASVTIGKHPSSIHKWKYGRKDLVPL